MGVLKGMDRRRLLITILLAVLVASAVRIGYEPLGWGGYWYVGMVPPWQR